MKTGLRRTGPVRRSRAQWIELVEEWRLSGLPVRDFCQRKGVLVKTFSWWRWVADRPAASGGAEGPAASEPCVQSTATTPLRFVEVTRPGEVGVSRVDWPTGTVAPSSGVEVVVGRGRVVRVGPGFHHDTLRAVVHLLEEVDATC